MFNVMLNENKPLFCFEMTSFSSHDFQQAVKAYRCAVACCLNNHHCASPTVLLFESNIYQFAIRLFALTLEGATVILPPNDQPLMIEELITKVDFTAGSIHNDDVASLERLKGDTSLPNQEDCYWPKYGKICFYTSGSSGQAKLIEKNWSQLNKELMMLTQVFPLYEPSAFLATVSHQHIYGLLFRLLLPLMNAHTIYETIEYPEQAQEIIKDLERVVFVSSPAFLNRLLKDNLLISQSNQLSYVFSSGGLLLDESACTLAEQLNQSIIQVYGSTETGGIAYRTVNALPASLWTFFPQVTCQIEGNSQRLILTSPFVEQQKMILDDTGYIDDGKLRLLGRIDRTIKLEEKRVNLSQMEIKCTEHPWVEEIKIISLQGQRTILAGVVKLSLEGKIQLKSHGKRSISEALRTHLVSYFELVTLPRKWRYISEFPYNSQGKLPWTDMEKLFASTY